MGNKPPTDVLGNRIFNGDMLLLRGIGSDAFVSVKEILPPNDKGVGTIRVIQEISITYDTNGRPINNAVCVRSPESQRLVDRFDDKKLSSVPKPDLQDDDV